MPANVLRDQKALWASPFRIQRKNAKWWIAMGAVTGVLIATDRRARANFRIRATSRPSEVIVYDAPIRRDIAAEGLPGSLVFGSSREARPVGRDQHTVTAPIAIHHFAFLRWIRNGLAQRAF